MTIKELRTASLIDLMKLLQEVKDQDQINIIAFEITCRMYIPFSDVSFDELLLQMGYRPKDKLRNKEL